MRHWLATEGSHYNELNARIATFNVDVLARRFTRWNEYQLTGRTVTQTELLASTPASILAGGDLHIEGDGAKFNDNSHIVAGGRLTVIGQAVENRATQGIRSVSEQGQVRQRTVRDRGALEGDDVKYTAWQDFSPAPLDQRPSS